MLMGEEEVREEAISSFPQQLCESSPSPSPLPSSSPSPSQARQQQQRVEYFWNCGDVVAKCFLLLGVRDLCSASLVCRSWLELIDSKELWFRLMDELHGGRTPLELPMRRNDGGCNIQREREGCSTRWGVRKEEGARPWKRLAREMTKLCSMKMADSIAAEGVAESSQTGNRGIEWTLCNECYWESAAISNPDTLEFLTFRLRQPLCLVTAVEILPAPLRRCYAPKYMKIQVGFGEEQVLFESEDMSVDNEPMLQRFNLPRRLITGDHVRLQFRGTHDMSLSQTSAHDNVGQHSICIQRVRIFGFTLGALEDNLLSESLVNYALRFPQFRYATMRALKPAVGEQLRSEDIVLGLRRLPQVVSYADVGDDEADRFVSPPTSSFRSGRALSRTAVQFRLGRS